jgi:hypothetical protein
MMLDYDGFLSAARQAEPDGNLHRELGQLFAEPSGTLRVLVAMILQQRDQLVEALVKTHMVDEAAIRRAIGTQGQLSGIDTVLQSIFGAMRKPTDEPAEEVSTDQHRSAP